MNRTTEVHTSTVRSTDQVDGRVKMSLSQRVQALQHNCGGLVRSDYPAIVVFATIIIIVLSFVIQQKVE